MITCANKDSNSVTFEIFIHDKLKFLTDGTAYQSLCSDIQISPKASIRYLRNGELVSLFLKKLA